jgi:hypothetical protein
MCVCVFVYTQANVHAHMQIHITDKQAEDWTWMDLAQIYVHWQNWSINVPNLWVL